MRDVASPVLTRTMRIVRSDLERMLSERTSTDSRAPHTRTIDPDSIDTFVRRFPTCKHHKQCFNVVPTYTERLLHNCYRTASGLGE